MADDIKSPGLEELDWSPANREASLSTVYRHAVDGVGERERWYREERGAHHLKGRVLRLTAILLGAVAAIVPLLSEVWTRNGNPVVPAAWATVAVVGAATCIALDRYGGYSSAWARFMSTWLHLVQLRHGFEAEWRVAAVSASQPLSDEAVLQRLALASELEQAVDAAVIDETGIWVAEFHGELDRVERSLDHRSP